MKDTPIIISTKEPFKTGKLTVKVYILGLTGKFMMENGKMESRMDMEYGKEFLEILSLVSGKIVRLMVMGCISGKMEIGMKENGALASSMGRGLIYLQMEIHLQELINKASLRALVNINGKMKVFTWVNSKMD
jgi:hypothetical protein